MSLKLVFSIYVNVSQTASSTYVYGSRSCPIPAAAPTKLKRI
jgi:hypothetical protein